MIDFHCHLDLYPDPHAVVRECVAKGMYVLSVTTTPSAWHGTTALSGESPRIRTALGLHPQLVHQRKSELPLFERLLPEARYVGEVGLDGTPEFRASWREQELVFERVLAACRKAGGRVMSVHSRHAASAVLDQLSSQPNAGTAVLHWFSGRRAELKRATDAGCWFSVGVAMLSSKSGRALTADMPRDRVLTESDGPFAQCSGRPSVPWDVSSAIELLADVWGVPPTSVRDTLNANLRRLSSLSNGMGPRSAG